MVTFSHLFVTPVFIRKSQPFDNKQPFLENYINPLISYCCLYDEYRDVSHDFLLTSNEAFTSMIINNFIYIELNF